MQRTRRPKLAKAAVAEESDWPTCHFTPRYRLAVSAANDELQIFCEADSKDYQSIEIRGMDPRPDSPYRLAQGSINFCLNAGELDLLARALQFLADKVRAQTVTGEGYDLLAKGPDLFYRGVPCAAALREPSTTEAI